MEQPIVTKVFYDTFSEVIVTIKNVLDRPGVVASIFEALSEEISVNIINQNTGLDGLASITFSVPREVGERARDAIAAVVEELEIQTSVGLIKNATRVIVSGAGLGSTLFARVFKVLGDHECNIEIISTSTIKIECVVTGEDIDIKEAVLELQGLCREFAVEKLVTVTTIDGPNILDAD